jgi:NOL1/NOP2/fmu family ribosome biogenesis protein
MNKSKFTAFIAGVALMALAVGCQTTTNTNTNANANTAVVANTNANVNANTNANANANRRTTNANITREEYEKEKGSFTEEAKRLGRKIGAGANDGYLWAKTRAVLAATDDLRDSTINVDVDDAVVTLSGTVANQAQKTKAEQVARGVEGVKSVKNQLTVSATGGNTNQNTNKSADTNKNANTKY